MTRIGLLSDLHWASPGTVGAWHNPYDFDGLADRLELALDWVAQRGVDLLAVTGDLCHSGQADELEEVLDRLAATATRVVYVLGNHDVARTSIDRLPQAGGDVVLAGRPIEIGGVDICGVAVQGGQGWFGAGVRVPVALDDAEGRPLVVLSHFPLLSFADDVARQGLAYAGDAIRRDSVLDALRARRGASIVISGHIHARATRSAGHVLQLVSAPLIEPPYDVAVITVQQQDDGTLLVGREVQPMPGPGPTGPIPDLVDHAGPWLHRDGDWIPADSPQDALTNDIGSRRHTVKASSRILTTHVGSLPRPDDLAAGLMARDRGEPYEADRGDMAARVSAAVDDVVARQANAGIDIVSDGEMSKFGYSTYVKERMTGFGGEGRPLALSEFADVPGFAPRVALELDAPGCDGPVEYVGHAALAADIANLEAAIEHTPVAAAFMNAASPGIIGDYLANEHYADQRSYLYALAEAMKVEYDAIVGAGLTLQVDCPDLAMGRHLAAQPLDFATFRSRIAERVEILNHALRDVPRDRVRIHLCWGNYESPHHHDVPLAEILDIVLRAEVGAILFEAANPRHEHEWEVFREIELPEGMVIVPGVIDSLTNYVEHPELVAQRILRYAELVGPERIVAGTDCGFATFANYINVHPQITWRKLTALAEGAALASQRLQSAAAAARAVRAG